MRSNIKYFKKNRPELDDQIFEEFYENASAEEL